MPLIPVLWRQRQENLCESEYSLIYRASLRTVKAKKKKGEKEGRMEGRKEGRKKERKKGRKEREKKEASQLAGFITGTTSVALVLPCRGLVNPVQL